uniref:Uncharacterized protein n=1 Tax=Arundo donax TaxID=35708 RepID=A0A0A9HSY3_ARUDO
MFSLQFQYLCSYEMQNKTHQPLQHALGE